MILCGVHILNFVKFYKVSCKPTSFSGTSYSLAFILNFQISQGSVATQLRRGGSLYDVHIKFSWEYVSEKV